MSIKVFGWMQRSATIQHLPLWSGNMIKSIQRMLLNTGVSLTRYPPPDLTSSRNAGILQKVTPYSKTSPERICAMCEAVRYVSSHGIPGDIVECGVWKGGSMMTAALVLLEMGDQSRGLHLFDTYEGMPPPGPFDVNAHGVSAADQLDQASKEDEESVWCVATLEEVESLLRGTGYDPEKMHFIKGLVEDTVPKHAPESISLLRLDTDWYESTRHELVHLYPRVSPGGVLIIDDYGHWDGARKAVDEYFAETRSEILLNRTDSSGRIGIKPGPR